jgi:phenylacetic acid degradation operon negative regulatory protein
MGQRRVHSERISFDCQDIIHALGVVGGHSTLRQMAALLGLARGITETVLRSGLYALVRRGRLTKSGRGKEATFAMGVWPAKRDTVAAKMAKSEAGWDGHWHVLTYDIGMKHNSLRHRLPGFLHEAGFGSLCASSWASPYDWEDELRSLLAGCDSAGSASYVRALDVAPLLGDVDPRQGEIWDLETIADRYTDIAGRCRAASKDRSPTAHKHRAVAWLRVTRELQQMESDDPMLPFDLLPKRWPRPSAIKSFERLRTRVRQDVAKIDER